MERKRNHSIDILRLIGAFFVICLHCFSGSGVWLGEEITALARFAVPMFFLISGYFAAQFTVKRKLRQIGKILLLAVISNVAYLSMPWWGHLYRWNRIVVLFRLTYMPINWTDFLLWNESPFSAHLWFLGAMLYVLLIDLALSPLFRRLKHRTPLLWAVAGVLAVGGFVIYHVLTANGEVDYHLCYYRSFLLFALPFFLAGKLLRENSFGKRPLPWGLYPAGILALCGLTLIEHGLLGPWELYLGSAALPFLLLHLAIAHPLEPCPAPAAFPAWLGRHTTLFIYIAHVYVLNLLRDWYYQNYPWQYEFGLFHLIPPAVLLITAAAGSLPALCAMAGRKLFSKKRG